MRIPQERELGQQVRVWFDGLGGGLAVDHEHHASREDIVGQRPAVGVVGRPGAVVVKEIGDLTDSSAVRGSYCENKR